MVNLTHISQSGMTFDEPRFAVACAAAAAVWAIWTVGGWTGGICASSADSSAGAWSPTGYSVGVQHREEDIERALRIGRALDAERAHFHGPYVLGLDSAPVEQIEILTEFRRVVLFAEERIRLGDHLFGVRQAEEALRPWRGRLTIVAHVRFHPLNTYVIAPTFQVTLGQPPILPRDLRQMTLEAPGSSPASPGSAGSGRRGKGPAQLTGAVVEADFDASLVGRVRQVVRVISEDREVARVEVDFAQLE